MIGPKKQFEGKPLVVNYKGRVINLAGKKLEQKIEGGEHGPPIIKIVKGATQKELKDLLDHPEIYGDFNHILEVKKKDESDN